MKVLFFVLNLFGASLASAEAVNLTCITQFPTTSFVFEQQKDRVTLQVLNHNGAAYMPFWNGLLVPNDIPLITEKADLMKKVGNDFHTSWPAAECKVYSKNNFSCIGNGQVAENNGTKIEPWSVSVSDIEQRTLGDVFKKKTVFVRTRVNGVDANIMMDFAEHECVDPTQVSTKKKKALKF